MTPSVRLYGRGVGHGSHAQVTAGFANALKSAGLLAGFVAFDCDPGPDDPQPGGALAPRAVFTGPLGFLPQMRRGTRHAERYAMLAPNSSFVPGNLLLAMEQICTEILVPSKWALDVVEENTSVPVRVVPHGVAPGFTPNPELRALLRAAYELGEFEVLHLSSTAYDRKGTFALLTAWGMLMAKGGLPPEARLRLVLEMDAMGKTMAWIAEQAGSGLPLQNVVVTVRMDAAPERLAETYAGHHIVCQPSRGEGFGLCLKRGTLITTPAGATPIETIQRGDLVLTVSGSWSSVTATAQRKGKKLLRVQALGCPELLITREHRVLAMERAPKEKAQALASQQPIWIPAGSLTTDHYLVVRGPLHHDARRLPGISMERYTDNVIIDGERCVSKYASRVGAVTAAQIAAVSGYSVRLTRRALEPGETGRRIDPKKRATVREVAGRLGYFDDRRPWLPRSVPWSVDLCRLLGYYAAEGSTGAKKKEGFVQFSLHAAKDAIPVVQIEHALQSVFGLRAQHQRKGPHGLNLNVSSVPLARLMKELCGSSARTKHLPSAIWSLPRDAKLACLEALIRGDGHNGYGSLEYRTVSPTLALQVRDLWLSLGVFASMRSGRARRLYPRTLTPLRIHGALQTTGKKLVWDVAVQGSWYPIAAQMIGFEPRSRAKTNRRGCKAVPLASIPDAWLVRVVSIGRHRTNASVHDLQVATDPSFVANGVVVHNCPLEALACGVPIVATACTGCSEWFESGLAGAVRVEHGSDAPIDDGPGARAPSVEPDAIAAALREAYARWKVLDYDAGASAATIRERWAWPKQLAPFIGALSLPVEAEARLTPAESTVSIGDDE